MSCIRNSVIFTAELTLTKFYVRQAVEKSSLKSLKDVDETESEELVAEFVVPAVQQSVKDVSNVGNWRDEANYILGKIHGWFFVSWMTTKFGDGFEMFPVGTVFYLKVLTMCGMEKFLIQCLSNVSEEVMKILIQDIVSCNKSTDNNRNILLELIEQCLSQLGNSEENFGKILDARICDILTQIVKNIEGQWTQIDILTKLINKLNVLLEQFQKDTSHNLENVLAKKMDVIELNERLLDIVSKMESKLPSLTMKNSENNSSSVEKTITNPSQESIEAMLSLVSCIHHLITTKWKSLLTWQFNDLGKEIVKEVQDTKCHAIFFSLLTACKTLQTLMSAMDPFLSSSYKLQFLINMLEPYFQQHLTAEDVPCVEDIADANYLGREFNGIADKIGMMGRTLQEKLEHALYQINESLLGDKECFEWLLLQEELYVNKSWLKCVESNSEKFISIKIMKMLLDVLSVLQEFDIVPGGIHANTYNSLKKVILNQVHHLTLPEQKEVVLYNFELSCLHFHSWEYSFYLHAEDENGASLVEDILTRTLNKLVNKSNHKGFGKDVMDGIIIGCLISPHLTLKELLSEASNRPGGYEKVVCELLQTIPWLARLARKDDEKLIVEILKFQAMFSRDLTKKQEGQFLKLIEALMQPYVHHNLGTEEPPLATASEISKDLVVSVLTDEEGEISTTLVLHILLKCFSCGLISIHQQPHCTVDRDHVLELLFIVLEIYEDIEQFWKDWEINESDLESIEFDDVTLLDIWEQMDVALKIVEEYLVPFLAEDISREPGQYSDHMLTAEDHFRNLDWTAKLLIIPLLQTDVFKECVIKLPSSLTHLMSSHVNVESAPELEPSMSFWRMYFKSCAHSNEVLGMFLSKLKQSYPRDPKAEDDSAEIIHDLAKLLPLSTRAQWHRVLHIAVEVMNCGYLVLPDEWKDNLMALPAISKLDGNITVKTSELLVLILRCVSNMKWRTSYLWLPALKNFVSSIKDLSLELGDHERFEVSCHLMAHLAYTAFEVVPETFQEHITIILLDVFNRCLSCMAVEDVDKSLQYVQGIISMISHAQLKLAMKNTMMKTFPNSVGT